MLNVVESNVARPSRLEELVERNAQEAPDHVALRVGTRSLTYSELMDTARRWAMILRSARNDGAPQSIGILCERGFVGYVGILAGLCAGATVQPLPMDAPVSRINEMVNSGRIDALVVDSKGAEILKGLAMQYELPPVFAPELSNDQVSAGSARILSENDAPSEERRVLCEIAYVLFTSGSTGRPKGVPISHANVTRFISSVLARYAFTRDDVFTQNFNLTFDLAFFDLFVAWASGGTVVHTPLTAFRRLPTFLARENVTVWFSAPSAIATLGSLGGLQVGSMPTLRWSLFCGESLLWKDAVAWRSAAQNSSIENLYGPTELTIACTAYRVPLGSLELQSHGIVPIGDFLPGMEYLLLDDDDAPCAEVGELCVSGTQMFDGYIDSGNDLDVFVEIAGCRWYRTGDMVRVGDAGLLFLGRKDDQVKIRGHRIEPAEIEGHLRAIVGVESAVVLAVGEGPDRRLVAFCVGSKIDRYRIGKSLSNVLPAHMLPRDYLIVDRFPLDDRGKIDRRSLIGLYSYLRSG